MTKESMQMADENTTLPERCANRTVLPEEIQKFNWGAFFLSWIWGIGNRSYITFFAFLVYVASMVTKAFGASLPLCLAFSIYCGVMGNEWAFKNRVWESTEHFNRVQKRWAIAGALFFVLARIFVVMLIALIVVAGFYVLVPNGDIKKSEDVSLAIEKGVTKFVQYGVESSLDGTDMSDIKNSNELAHEIASGFGKTAVGNTIYIGNNPKNALKAYKYGDCTLQNKNCYVEIKSGDRTFMKYYIDENKKLVPVKPVRPSKKD